MNLYAMTSKYGADLPAGFLFHARTQAEADRKAIAYNRYHGLCDTNGSGWQVAILTSGAVDSRLIHDEYVSYLA